jgi:hypothetical protein
MGDRGRLLRIPSYHQPCMITLCRTHTSQVGSAANAMDQFHMYSCCAVHGLRVLDADRRMGCAATSKYWEVGIRRIQEL